jgi:hypothetical protein
MTAMPRLKSLRLTTARTMIRRARPMKMKFDAVVLEALYQLCKQRGWPSNRELFLALGQRVVAQMYARGELS